MDKKLIFLISLAVLFGTASASADLVAHWKLDDGSARLQGIHRATGTTAPLAAR